MPGNYITHKHPSALANIYPAMTYKARSSLNTSLDDIPCRRSSRMLNASCRFASRRPCSSTLNAQWNHCGSAKPSARFNKHLPRRRLQQIRPAYHLRDPHRRVISHAGQLITRHPIPPPHQEISEVHARHKPLLFPDSILKCQPTSPSGTRNRQFIPLGLSPISPDAPELRCR